MFSQEIQQVFLELHAAMQLELDATRQVREVNTRGKRTLGAQLFDVVGTDWLDFINGASERQRARRLLADALDSGDTHSQELEVVDMCGGVRRVTWRCVARRDDDGRHTGWLCSGVDVTEQALREERAHGTHDRLTRVARLATMGEMAAGMAHELNQPLTAITSYARAGERHLDKPDPDLAELRVVLREINAEGMRAGEIIRRLRRLVRTEEVDHRLPLDINRLIEELRTLLQSDARAHGSELRISLSPDLPRIVGNSVQLQHVVLNLARNAFEAVAEFPAGGRHVEVTTAIPQPGELEIQVADNGPGIAPQIADRLFDPFATTKGTGTGLGLAISRTIVQTHGGTIGARRGPLGGAAFFVRLPVQEERFS
jgi:PAS domain S-box-containing protein